jgi:hypothetical protein
MNHRLAALNFADLLLKITDPEITRWEKEQTEILARNAANNYTKKYKEMS